MTPNFPNPWTTADSIELLFGFLAVAATALALYFDRRSQERLTAVMWPSVPQRMGEDATDYSSRRAAELAERRAILRHSSLYREVSTIVLFASVFSAFVAATPWLAIPGLLVIAATGFYAWRLLSGEPKAIRQRLELLKIVREIHEYSLSTPYILETYAWAEVEEIFTTPADRLDDLEQTLRNALIRQRDKHRAYVAEQKRRMEGNSQGDGGVSSAGN